MLCGLHAARSIGARFLPAIWPTAPARPRRPVLGNGRTVPLVPGRCSGTADCSARPFRAPGGTVLVLRRPFRNGRALFRVARRNSDGNGRASASSFRFLVPLSLRPARPTGKRKQLGSGAAGRPGAAGSGRQGVTTQGVTPSRCRQPVALPAPGPHGLGMNAPTGAAPVPALCRAVPLPVGAAVTGIRRSGLATPARQRRAQKRRRTAYARDFHTTGEHPPWRNMAKARPRNPRAVARL